MRIVIAMSGGVDSSVAAALLKNQGYEVVGLSMQIWGNYRERCERSCCSPSHLEDARAVAVKLGIPHYVVDFRNEFESKVVDYFCREYLCGRTPNPCIICNDELKFKTLWAKAQALGAERIATGHYARIIRESGQYWLKRGLDRSKDQSYFLFGLSEEMLAHTLFPLGEYTKSQTREMAKSLGLSVAQKKESQEICFIPDNNYQEFLKKRHPECFIKGDILDVQGRKLGVHQGIAHYTIGQRRGLGLFHEQPLYVIKIDAVNNNIMVGEKKDLAAKGLLASGGNIDRFSGIIRMQAQIRYRHTPVFATLYPLGNNKAKIEFDQPQFAVTPGQAAVFYQDDTVLGGGWIEEAL
ncbi:MAG: tRNA 2-thiouridine(34) synthase MnmA [Candidatus Schekmanbacteria bacterium]|nr:tRNA 2-thiouridine(34) synthase MnmA [Candidatus Schekmanbacteria bacterium]